MMNKNKPRISPPYILLRALYQDSRESYSAFGKMEFWSFIEFSSLVAGISPLRYEEIIAKSGPLPTNKELKQIKQAYALSERLLQDRVIFKDIRTATLVEDTKVSSWKFVKWAAINEVAIIVKFFRILSLTLMELFIEFQPINMILRNASKFSRGYHEALYLKHSSDLIEESPVRLTRNQIWANPRMQNVMDQFMDNYGKRVHYTKRTIIESWLKKIDSQGRRGRPKTRKN